MAVVLFVACGGAFYYRSRARAAIRDAATLHMTLDRIAEPCEIALLRCDLEGIPRWANAAFVALAGGAIGSERLARWPERLELEDAEQFDRAFARVRATKQAVACFVRADARGAARRYRARIDPLIADDRCTGYLVALTDQTKDERSAEAVARSEALYRLVAENTRDIIMRLSLDGVPLFVSSAVKRVLGAPPAAFVGRSLRQSVHPGDWTMFERLLGELPIGGELPELRFRQRRASGDWVWLEATFQPVFEESGEPREVIATVRNIHRRQLAEQIVFESTAKLRESNRYLALAEEMAQIAHWRLSIEDSGFDHGHGLFRMSGSIPGRPLRSRDLLRKLSASDRRKLLAALRETRLRRAAIDCTIHLEAPGPGDRQLRIGMQAERDRSGTVTGYHGIVHDETRAAEAHAELVRTRDEARAAVDAQTAFFVSLVEEIRTPLDDLILTVDRLRATDDPEERDDNHGLLKRRAEHLAALLEDLEDLTALDQDQLHLSSCGFRFEDVVAEAVSIVEPKARQKGVCLKVEEAIGAPVAVRGDPVRLRQAIGNLLAHAVDRSPAGLVQVTLDVRSRIDLQRWRVEIRERGSAMKDEELCGLFDAFSSQESADCGTPGRGRLGLAIASRIVSAMGGELSATSALGGGIVYAFELLLPVADLPVSLESSSPKMHDNRDGRSLDLLVAEDNPLNRNMLVTMLETLGHRVKAVRDGSAAVRASRRDAYDAVILDMQMPEMDGVAASRQIRRDAGEGKRVPIIALTADASTERRRFYESAGLDAFLTKPVDSGRLARTLVELTSPSRAEDRARTEGAESVRPYRGAASDAGDAAEEDAVLFDQDRIDELRSVLGAARFENLIGLLKVELELRPDQLRAAFDERDTDRVRAEAHSLKGAAASAGASAVCTLAARIESEDEPVSLPGLLDRLDTLAIATLAAIEDLLGSDPVVLRQA
ncbi:response regulator [Sphingomicrobium sp. XHP0235]|uniref:response regulator n=1 Tax=Sphingomicrobium aquimarinum TaxID=3133971 RepID=UPI0031FEFCED